MSSASTWSIIADARNALHARRLRVPRRNNKELRLDKRPARACEAGHHLIALAAATTASRESSIQRCAPVSICQTAILLGVARKYGKIPKKWRNRSLKRGDGDSAAFKYRLRGKEDAWLGMHEVIARDLRKYQDHRAKWATFYILLVDADGKEILIDPSGEEMLHPYKSAADEFGA